MEKPEVKQPEVPEEESKPKGKWWHGAIAGGAFGLFILLLLLISDLYDSRFVDNFISKHDWAFTIKYGGVLIFVSVGIGGIGGVRAMKKGADHPRSTGLLYVIIAFVLLFVIVSIVFFVRGLCGTFGFCL